jgi:hypothetical protein
MIAHIICSPRCRSRFGDGGKHYELDDLSLARIRQCKGKFRTGANAGRRRDAAPMALDNALHDREPDACAAKLRTAVESVESFKKLVSVSHVKARAIVADAIRALAALFMSLDRYDRLDDQAAELDGIRQEVNKHLFEERRVREGIWKRVQSQLHTGHPRKHL